VGFLGGSERIEEVREGSNGGEGERMRCNVVEEDADASVGDDWDGESGLEHEHQTWTAATTGSMPSKDSLLIIIVKRSFCRSSSRRWS